MDLKVLGNLNLMNRKITSLPESFHVGGDLNINNCTQLTTLPRGLVVGKSLYAKYTNLQILPDDIVVSENCDLEKSKISVRFFLF